MSLAVSLEIVADVLFKKWSLGSKNYLFIAGMIIYMIGTAFWAYSLKFENLSRAISVFVISNLIILVLVGVFIFKEKLSLVNKIGIIIGIIGIILIEI